jgi:hypothetical protein
MEILFELYNKEIDKNINQNGNVIMTNVKNNYKNIPETECLKYFNDIINFLTYNKSICYKINEKHSLKNVDESIIKNKYMKYKIKYLALKDFIKNKKY